MRERRFLHFRFPVTLTFDLQASDLKFALLVNLVQRFASSKLYIEVQRLSYFKKIGGSGREDGQTYTN